MKKVLCFVVLLFTFVNVNVFADCPSVITQEIKDALNDKYIGELDYTLNDNDILYPIKVDVILEKGSCSLYFKEEPNLKTNTVLRKNIEVMDKSKIKEVYADKVTII